MILKNLYFLTELYDLDALIDLNGILRSDYNFELETIIIQNVR